MAKKSACTTRASHRKAQAKYVAKAPKAQAKRVKKSAGKNSGGSSGGGKSSSGKGQHGSTIGRPRKKC
jgi:hypothetical protein